MKKNIWKILFLFPFLLIVFFSFNNAQGNLIQECSEINGHVGALCWEETSTLCMGEDYEGDGILPEDNIIYGSDILEKRKRRFCESSSPEVSCLESPIIESGQVIRCNKNEYCNTNQYGDFICQTGEACEDISPSTISTSEPINPQNSTTTPITTPVTLDWCDVEGYDSYNLKMYERTSPTTTERIYITDDPYYNQKTSTTSEQCVKGLKNNTVYEWEVDYRSDYKNDALTPRWTFETEFQQSISPPSNITIEGAPPAEDNNNGVSTPVTIYWNDVSGAKSYFVDITKEVYNETIEVGDRIRFTPPTCVFGCCTEGMVTEVHDMGVVARPKSNCWPTEGEYLDEWFYWDIWFEKIYEEWDVETRTYWASEVTESKIDEIYIPANTVEIEAKVASCLNPNGTACGDTCCANEEAKECADWSNIKEFETNNKVTKIETVKLQRPFYSPENPTDIPFVSPTDQFVWKHAIGAKSYAVQIVNNQLDEDATIFVRERKNHYNLGRIWAALQKGIDEFLRMGFLEPDQNYTWKVTGCRKDVECNPGIEDCMSKMECMADSTSNEWKFKTVGGSPVITNPEDGESSLPIPIEFQWKNSTNTSIPSYYYRVEHPDGTTGTTPLKPIETDKKFIVGTTTKSHVTFEYPFSSVGQTYSFQIKGCSGENGDFCEEDFQENNFTFNPFTPPTNTNPENGGELKNYIHTVSWDPVPTAKAYQTTIQYVEAENERDPECTQKAENNTLIAENVITTNNRLFLPELKCLGKYEWFIASCFEEDCSKHTTTTPTLEFHYVSKGLGGVGLLPCERTSDDLDTPWDERDQCQFKHIPILAYNILDFLLWKASIFGFFALLIFSGIVAYASSGFPIQTVAIKTIWKTAGKGYAIIFFAWISVNVFMRLVGITDKWWILRF